MTLRSIFYSALALCATLAGTTTGYAAEPLARIAVISNTYLTTLPPQEIKDESGRVRDFLAKTGPDSLRNSLALVKQLQPDALVVLGSLTWSGSEDDFHLAEKHFHGVEVPTFFVPGHRDALGGSLDTYQRIFGNRDSRDQVRNVNGVMLAFAGDLHTQPDVAATRLNAQLDAHTGRTQAVVLFANRDRSIPRSRLAPDHAGFAELVKRHHIAARLEPTRYGHQLGYEGTLPTWTVGSTAWSTRGAITLIRVFADRLELAEIADPERTAFSLTIPNPVNAPRLPQLADDPYGCPSYSADLKLKPDFTFALVSDPQFDREQNREYLIRKADAAITELNRLQPAMVFVCGDLVNNNLPEEWELFQQVFAKLKSPQYVVPGNHDVLFNYDFVEASYSSAPQRRPDYAAIVKDALTAAAKEGYQGPTALYEKYTGTPPRRLIEHNGCAFITVPFLTTRADAEQIEFLKAQLQKTLKHKHVFVVAHYPSLPAFGNNLQPQLGGTQVLSMLHEHRVTGYLFGHRHRNGFQMHERTAHVLTDNMTTIHLLHVFRDRVIVGRKRVGGPLYEKLSIPSPRG